MCNNLEIKLVNFEMLWTYLGITQTLGVFTTFYLNFFFLQNKMNFRNKNNSKSYMPI